MLYSNMMSGFKYLFSHNINNPFFINNNNNFNLQTNRIKYYLIYKIIIIINLTIKT